MILPRKSWVTKLIIKDAHEKRNHAFGTNQTLAILSARYWIISAREAIQEWERECADCRHRKAKVGQQIMAPLPLARDQTSMRAFTRTSVDFGGPFLPYRGEENDVKTISMFVYVSGQQRCKFRNSLQSFHGLISQHFLQNGKSERSGR